jgi:dynein heavy chain
VVANLRKQKKMFDAVNSQFKNKMGHNAAIVYVSVSEFCYKEGFANLVAKMTKDLEYLDKSLTEYLDKKRGAFSRLYFTSNDELIGLMGNLADQSYIQVFLSKLFDGIAGLIFGEKTIVGFYSKSNEQVYFKDHISTEMPPEVWLKEVELGMKKTIYWNFPKCLTDLMTNGVTDTWIQAYSGQLVILASHVMFNIEIETVFRSRVPNGENNAKCEDEVPLEEVLDKVVGYIKNAANLMK